MALTQTDSSALGLMTSQNGDVYFQKFCGGPITYLGCVGVGELNIPEPTVEAVWCYSNGKKTYLGDLTDEGTDLIDTSITIPATVKRTASERILDDLARCVGGYLYLTYGTNCAVPGDIATADRLYRMKIARVAATTLFPEKNITDSKPTAGNFGWKVWLSSVVKIVDTTGYGVANSLAVPAGGITGIDACGENCSACGQAAGTCEHWLGFNAASNVIYISTTSATGASGAAQAAAVPFANAVRAVLCVRTGRKLAFSLAGAGVGQYSYSDTNGASWVAAALPSAAIGEGVTSQQAVAHLATGEILAMTNTATPATSGRLYRSTNNGATLTRVTTGAPVGFTVNAIYFSDINNGVAVGNNGANIGVARTTDGGITWASLTTPGAGTGNDALMDGAGGIYVASSTGLWYYAAGATIATLQSPALPILATQWLQIESGGECCLYGLVVNAATGARQIVRTYDGGATWRIIGTPNGTLNTLSVCNCEHFVAAGGNGAAALIVKSTDPA